MAHARHPGMKLGGPHITHQTMCHATQPHSDSTEAARMKPNTPNIYTKHHFQTVCVWPTFQLQSNLPCQSPRTISHLFKRRISTCHVLTKQRMPRF